MSNIKIIISWGNAENVFECEEQIKTFKDKTSCIRWYNKHYKNIGYISGIPTNFEKPSKTLILTAIALAKKQREGVFNENEIPVYGIYRKRG